MRSKITGAEGRAHTGTVPTRKRPTRVWCQGNQSSTSRESRKRNNDTSRQLTKTDTTNAAQEVRHNARDISTLYAGRKHDATRVMCRTFHTACVTQHVTHDAARDAPTLMAMRSSAAVTQTAMMTSTHENCVCVRRSSSESLRRTATPDPL